MRRIRYQVACSLDGYIVGPAGDVDWIVHEPQIDFQELFDQFDLLELDAVDTVEPAIMPAIVGGGTPLLPAPAVQKRLTLTRHRVFPSGIVWVEYAVLRTAADRPTRAG